MSRKVSGLLGYGFMFEIMSTVWFLPYLEVPCEAWSEDHGDAELVVFSGC